MRKRIATTFKRGPVTDRAGTYIALDKPHQGCNALVVSNGVPEIGLGERTADLAQPPASLAQKPASAPRVFMSTVFHTRIMLDLLAVMVWTAPAFSGVPFVTDDADSPDAGHFEINIAAQYTRFQGGSVSAIPSVEVNYGLTRTVELTIEAPLAMSHVDNVGTNVGIGDVRLSVKYRFIDADDWGWRPAVAFYPAISLPSGSEVRGLGEGRMQGFLPIWISKEFNQWTVFTGGGYNINPGLARRNWWFAGLGVTRELDPAWTIGAEIYHSTPIANGVKSNTGFNVGVIYNISDVHHLLLSVGRNLINARENNELSTYVGYQLTF
jgi:hypothetical protein